MRTIKPPVMMELSAAGLAARLRPVQRGNGRVRLQHLIIKNFDFSNLKLPRAEIYNVVLERCRFRRTDLSGGMCGELKAMTADFREAGFENADIVWSWIEEACFDNARLARADFFMTDLAQATFRGADLTGATFSQCDLSGADFSSARLDATRFVGCRHRGARGLDERHLAYEPAMFSQYR
jgi:uncharacterized protein YjbI with pentapeptide repeats